MKRLATRIAGPALAAALAAFGCGGAQDAEPTTPAAPEDPADSSAADVESGEGPDGIAQAERGAAVYESNCGFCHGDAGEGAGKNPPVVGDGVLASYAHAGEILEYVSTEMPADDPGGLSVEEFQDVVAFMLQANGVDLTGTSVTAETAADITF